MVVVVATIKAYILERIHLLVMITDINQLNVDDMLNGDRLRQIVLANMDSLGLPVRDMLADLHSADFPYIDSVVKQVNGFEIRLDYDSDIYGILVPGADAPALASCLALLYGYGNLRHNYDLSCFSSMKKDCLSEYLRFAVELWDRNIHIDWMRSQGYLLHNGTKDFLFLLRCHLMMNL